MAFFVDHVKIGNRIVAINNMSGGNRAACTDYLALLSSRHLTLKLDRMDGRKVGLEIPRRQMKRFEACMDKAVPFLAFQLKPTGYEALTKKMGEKVEGWIVVFFSPIGPKEYTDLGGMVKTLAEYNRNVLGHPDAYELLNKIGCKKQQIVLKVSAFFLNNLPSNIDGKKAINIDDGGIAYSKYEFFVRKVAAFLHGSAKIKLSETDEIFPKMLMMNYTMRYLTSLECVQCGDRAFSKCSVCLETRYCSTACQDAMQEQHTEVCARLVEEREAEKAFEEEVVKMVVPDSRRKEFARYEEKLAASWNKYARESLRETDRDASRQLPAWHVTITNLYSS
jgi:hypothetical protein